MTEEIKIPSGIVDNGTEIYFDIHKLDMSMLQVYKDEIDRLKQDNERLKIKNKQLEDFIKSDGEIDYINHEYTYKLRKALEEIRGIATQRFVSGLNEEADAYNNDMQRIETKINEVLE